MQQENGYPHDQSARIQTAHAFLTSYSALSASAHLNHVSLSFTHQILPASLDMPVRTRDEFAAHASQVTSIFSSFAMVPQTIFEDEKEDAVVVYAKMEGELMGGMERLENECVIWLRMEGDRTEEGVKIVEQKEFTDSSRFRILGEKLSGVGKADAMQYVMGERIISEI